MQNTQEKSDVELYWDAVAAKFGDDRAWSDLSPEFQNIVIQSVNALLFVLTRA